METLTNQATENMNVQPQSEPVKETYLAPAIEAMEVKVEKGYQSSLGPDRDNDRW